MPAILLTGKLRTAPVIRNCFMFVEWTCRPNFPKPSGLLTTMPKGHQWLPALLRHVANISMQLSAFTVFLDPDPPCLAGSTDSWLPRSLLHWCPGSFRQWLVEAETPPQSPDLTFVWFTERNQVSTKAVPRVQTTTNHGPPDEEIAQVLMLLCKKIKVH